jgi:membrane protein required for colicin V production
MNGVDVAIIVAGGLGIVSGLGRGMLRMATSLIALAAGIYLAFVYYPAVRDIARKFIPMSTTLAAVVGYAIVFLLVLVIVQSAGGVLLRLVRTVNLGWMDRLAGGAAGGAITLAIMGLVLMMVTATLPTSSTIIRGSRLAPPVLHYTDALLAYIPPEVKQAYDQKRDQLMRNWAGEALQGKAGPSAAQTP